MREAVAFVRSGAGCAMVHAQCVRIHSHSNSDRHELYRTPEELDAARDADPLPRFRKLLLETGLVSEEELAPIEAQNERTYEEAADRREGGARPEPATIYDFVGRSPGCRTNGPRASPTGPARR